MKTLALVLVLLSELAIPSFAASAAITEKTIEYQDAGHTYEGFVAMPKSVSVKKPAPGVLVIHNWFGVSEETRSKARALAQLGYVAFAADIYGKGIRPTSPADAGKLATQYKSDRKLYREHLALGLKTLESIPGVRAGAVAAIGYCFGGTGVIELARSGAAVKGVVSFHGGLDSPDPSAGKNIRARVLALHGADDPYVPAADLAAFESEMSTHKIDWELVKFGGAVHSFTDKGAGTDASKGAAYNESADRRSWEMMRGFLREVLN